MFVLRLKKKIVKSGFEFLAWNYKMLFHRDKNRPKQIQILNITYRD